MGTVLPGPDWFCIVIEKGGFWALVNCPKAERSPLSFGLAWSIIELTGGAGEEANPFDCPSSVRVGHINNAHLQKFMLLTRYSRRLEGPPHE